MNPTWESGRVRFDRVAGGGRVHFERMTRDGAGASRPVRRARHRWAVAGALLLVASLVAASSITVMDRKDTDSVYAERFSIAGSFEVKDSHVWVAKAARTAVGVVGAPGEMTPTPPEVRTALAKDQWVYTATVEESGPASVAAGNFTAELFLDEVSLGKVVFAQGEPEPGAVEGVKASFGIGAGLPTSGLYYIEVRALLATGPTVAYTVRSNPAADLTWVGVGGDIDGAVNPPLSLAAGSVLSLTARNGDGIAHNIGIKDASGTLVAGWTADIENSGDQVVLSWAPSVAGTYTYLCKYHAGTMKGTLTVTA